MDLIDNTCPAEILCRGGGHELGRAVLPAPPGPLAQCPRLRGADGRQQPALAAAGPPRGWQDRTCSLSRKGLFPTLAALGMLTRGRELADSPGAFRAAGRRRRAARLQDWLGRDANPPAMPTLAAD